MCLLPHSTVVLQRGVSVSLSLRQHVGFYLYPFLWSATRNGFEPYMPFVSSLLDIPLERGKRDPINLDNLASGVASVCRSQHTLA